MRVLNEKESREVAGGCFFPIYHHKPVHVRPRCKPAPPCVCPPEEKPTPKPPPAPTPD